MIQKKEVEFCKEVDDVAVLLVGLVADIKAGKSAGEIASDSVQNLINAVSGVEQLSDESKDRKVFLQTLGLRSAELADILLPK